MFFFSRHEINVCSLGGKPCIFPNLYSTSFFWGWFFSKRNYEESCHVCLHFKNHRKFSHSSENQLGESEVWPWYLLPLDRSTEKNHWTLLFGNLIYPCRTKKNRWKRAINPFEKYAGQVGSFPQGLGWKLKTNETTTQMGVSENRGTPKSSILMDFPLFSPSILGHPYFSETPRSWFWASTGSTRWAL